MRRILLAAAISPFLALASAPARAEFVITINQVGGGVVAPGARPPPGAGSVDLTGLTLAQAGGLNSVLLPANAVILLGPSLGEVDVYTHINGPSFFGTGPETTATSGSGDFVGIEGAAGGLVVPMGYVSGAALSTTSTYADQTFASLGLSPGVYTYTFGSGVHADSVVIDIGPPAVPEPSSLALCGIAGLAGLGVARGRKRAGIA